MDALTTQEKRTLRENVERGADYFDSVYPGWQSWIDHNSLNMRDGNNCICAKIFKHEFPRAKIPHWKYIADEVVSIYSNKDEDPWRIYDKYGFSVDLSGNYEAKYAYLTLLWLQMMDAPV